MGRLAPARRANPGPPRRDRFPSWGFDSSDSHLLRHARYESGWALHAPLSGMRPGLRRAPSWPEGGSAGHANPFESQNRLGTRIRLNPKIGWGVIEGNRMSRMPDEMAGGAEATTPGLPLGGGGRPEGRETGPG